jgi:hypothetical protein
MQAVSGSAGGIMMMSVEGGARTNVAGRARSELRASAVTLGLRSGPHSVAVGNPTETNALGIEDAQGFIGLVRATADEQ